jgi:hypothetical protein
MADGRVTTVPSHTPSLPGRNSSPSASVSRHLAETALNRATEQASERLRIKPTHKTSQLPLTTSQVSSTDRASTAAWRPHPARLGGQEIEARSTRHQSAVPDRERPRRGHGAARVARLLRADRTLDDNRTQLNRGTGAAARRDGDREHAAFVLREPAPARCLAALSCGPATHRFQDA